MGEKRVHVTQLEERHEQVSEVSRQHAGAADAWPNSALASAIALLLQQEAELAAAIAEGRVDIRDLEQQREHLLARIAELQAVATGFRP